MYKHLIHKCPRMSFFRNEACHERENLSSGFPTKSDSNWAIQPQKIAIGLKVQSCCCFRVLRPTNSKGHTETGPQFKVSSKRLEKPWIEPTTPGLQGECLYHFTTVGSEI